MWPFTDIVVLLVVILPGNIDVTVQDIGKSAIASTQKTQERKQVVNI